MLMIITAMQRVFFCFMKTADSTMPIIDNSRSIAAAVTVIIAPFCGRRTYFVSRVYMFFGIQRRRVSVPDVSPAVAVILGGIVNISDPSGSENVSVLIVGVAVCIERVVVGNGKIIYAVIVPQSAGDIGKLRLFDIGIQTGIRVGIEYAGKAAVRCLCFARCKEQLKAAAVIADARIGKAV